MKRRSRAQAATGGAGAQGPRDGGSSGGAAEINDNGASGDATVAEIDQEMTTQQTDTPSSNELVAAAASAGGNGPGSARVTRERALYFATGQRASPTSSAPSARRAAAQAAGEQKEAWPGYFATARDLGENRLNAQAARQEELQRKEQEDAKLAETKVVWLPRKKPRTTVLSQENLILSLQELALQCLAKHIELLPTLEYIDATARAQVATAVVKLRRMKAEVLPLFIYPGVTEIDIPDCSNIDEGSFMRTLKECLDQGLSLTILRLGLCGRCIADDAIKDLGDSLRTVEQLRVQGCYRLSDAGCEALVRRCAPSLQEFELSCNQRITKQSIDYFSELEQLHSLTLSECPQLDNSALASLLTMKNLRKIALNQMERLTDEFICELVAHLPNLEEISIARCAQLTDVAVGAILENCRSLKVLDLSDLHLLTDKCFEPLRTHGHPLRKVSICGCLGFTDNAIAHLAVGANAYLEVLEMSSIAETTDASLMALKEFCATGLQVLDISFCRKMSEDALGAFTDDCAALKSLVLWGCTQITARFLTCHSRDELLVTGHPLLTGLTIKY